MKKYLKAGMILATILISSNFASEALAGCESKNSTCKTDEDCAIDDCKTCQVSCEPWDKNDPEKSKGEDGKEMCTCVLSGNY